MADIGILGAGVCGLGTTLLLARDGRDVTVLERDDQDLMGSQLAAWEQWSRRGARQGMKVEYSGAGKVWRDGIRHVTRDLSDGDERRGEMQHLGYVETVQAVRGGAASSYRSTARGVALEPAVHALACWGGGLRCVPAKGTTGASTS